MGVLKNLKVKLDKSVRQGPLWEGPEGRGPNGGITFSALSRFLTCRERFRVKMIEGLAVEEKFNHRLEYGQMWHACEEALAAQKEWEPALLAYVKPLLSKHPMDREQVNHWYQVCKRQFPHYVKYWQKNADVKNRVPLLQERVFDVDYPLPSGRIVRLRGKWDSVDLLKNRKAVFLKENKTKGDINEQPLRRQLTFDLQTMMYLTALERFDWKGTPYGPTEAKPVVINGKTVMRNKSHLPQILPPIGGVVYNVVRRPLSGGKGSIRRHQATNTKPEETLESFYDRVEQYIIDEPETYFMRWEVNVSPADVKRFRSECLDPTLEQLCAWYQHIVNEHDNGTGTAKYFNEPFSADGHQTQLHWRHPFGAENSVDEYGFGDVDEYLNSGSMVGLRRVDKLFTELQ